jgi:uncharacterized protein YbaR (Trm112 family)
MTALDHDLLQRVVCPETRQKLAEGGAELLAELNRRIAAKSLANRGGKTVERPFDAVLVRADGQYAYPVREGIFFLFLDEAVPLAGVSGASASR